MLAALSVAACTFESRSSRGSAARTTDSGSTDVAPALEQSGAVGGSTDAPAYGDDGAVPDDDGTRADPSDDAGLGEPEPQS